MLFIFENLVQETVTSYEEYNSYEKEEDGVVHNERYISESSREKRMSVFTRTWTRLGIDEEGRICMRQVDKESERNCGRRVKPTQRWMMEGGRAITVSNSGTQDFEQGMKIVNLAEGCFLAV